MVARPLRRAVIIQSALMTADNTEPKMTSKPERPEKADYDYYDITCDIDGDILLKEMTFNYAADKWDPRVVE